MACRLIATKSKQAHSLFIVDLIFGVKNVKKESF